MPCGGWVGGWVSMADNPMLIGDLQETLRTSAFPSSHVKEKWAKNLYIAGIAYGRTVS